MRPAPGTSAQASVRWAVGAGGALAQAGHPTSTTPGGRGQNALSSGCWLSGKVVVNRWPLPPETRQSPRVVLAEGGSRRGSGCWPQSSFAAFVLVTLPGCTRSGPTESRGAAETGWEGSDFLLRDSLQSGGSSGGQHGSTLTYVPRGRTRSSTQSPGCDAHWSACTADSEGTAHSPPPRGQAACGPATQYHRLRGTDL